MRPVDAVVNFPPRGRRRPGQHRVNQQRRRHGAAQEECVLELQAAARDATAKAKTHVRRFESEAIAAMQQYGLTVHDVSDDAARRFATEIEASYPKLIGASIPEPIYRTTQAHLDAYRSPR